MAYSIVVKLSELRAAVQDARRDGTDYVKLSILDGEEFEGDIIPATLDISGCRINDLNSWVGYDQIEAVPENDQILG